jgi:hypothetical protein
MRAAAEGPYGAGFQFGAVFRRRERARWHSILLDHDYAGIEVNGVDSILERSRVGAQQVPGGWWRRVQLRD